MSTSEKSLLPRRPSLYAAITLARLVQRVRQHLKARVKTHKSVAKQPSIDRNADVHGYIQLSRALKVNPKGVKVGSYFGQHTLHDRDSSRVLGFAELVKCLEPHVTTGVHSLIRTASEDQLFLQHDFQDRASTSALKDHLQVLDLSTLLLERLEVLKKHVAVRLTGRDLDEVQHEKLLANLEHLLRCLQQAALNALIRRSLDLLESEVCLWYRYWQQKRRLTESRFAEWPGGRRPLNTTWPWNIRPSLVVLWGVCWMFFDNERRSPIGRECQQSGSHTSLPSASSREINSGDQQSYEGNWSAQDNSNQDGWQRPPHHLILKHNRVPGVLTNHGQDRSDTIGRLATSAPPSRFSCDAQSRILEAATSPLGFKRVQSVGNPYIIQSSSSPIRDGDLAASYLWPENQGNLLTQDIDAPFYSWQPTLPQTQAAAVNSHASIPTAVANAPYVAPFMFNSYTYQDSSPGHWASQESRPVGLIPPMHHQEQNSQDYPSPNSVGSKRASFECPAYIPNDISPSIAHEDIHHMAESSASPLSSKQRQEPAWNTDGQMFCTHDECADEPPVFMRRCEWTKHMDKHNRPHICQERGCEKIQGFTYSGGLLRHQREVHKQHGGPKAPQMCPYADCKRSTGTGFSRKENLFEHLRRVHRGVPEQRPTPAQPIVPTLLPLPSKAKKRRLEAYDAGPEHGPVPRDVFPQLDDSGDLREQIKRLRRESDLKDERLRTLESLVKSLFQQQQQQGVGSV